MPRRRIAGGITVMIVHGGLWRARAAGRVLGRGARHGEASQQSGIRVNPQPPRVVLSDGPAQAAQLAPVTKACGP